MIFQTFRSSQKLLLPTEILVDSKQKIKKDLQTITALLASPLTFLQLKNP